MSEGRYAVASDAWGWHERVLARAFSRRGAEAAFFSLRECFFRPDERGGVEVALPGFAGSVPTALFVRSVPGGSFEQVTRYLDILHALAACGVRVVNGARAIERTVDKAMTSFLLAQRGVAHPPSWTLESEEKACEVVRLELARGHRLVQKPLFGSQGRGLRLVEDERDLGDPDSYAGVFYLQRFVPTASGGGRDWRVFVVGGNPLAAMERRSESWITNRARGGSCRAVEPGREIGQLAAAACAAVGADYAGVDVIAAPDGALTVLEVNGIPAWRGLQEASGVEIAETLVSDLIDPGRRRLEIAS